ncbi:MAG: DUF4079 domain-containing protein [Cyanobacteria bacterium QS_8_64_29]|nr:MAG: DUF4079 domain-containing protein [Cyanobacteria bacterium QS_8_64_29]
MEGLIPESVKTWAQFFHPVVMLGLFAATLYALYLGLQVRRTRTTEDPNQRKELAKQRFNVRHHQVGGVLLALIPMGAIGGMAVTYLNNGKLFVIPHLFAGLGVVALVALSAALVPFMQQGQLWARYTHISLNGLVVALFGWQAVSGAQILLEIVANL